MVFMHTLTVAGFPVFQKPHMSTVSMSARSAITPTAVPTIMAISREYKKMPRLASSE